jgi:hypothetical protein
MISDTRLILVGHAMLTRPNIQNTFIYKREFNSPSIPPVSITTPGTKEWRPHLYQLKLICPFCGKTGYSQWNIVRLDVMLNFPLCWTEECCYCKESFFINNGVVDACVLCRHQLDCLERPLGTLELLQNY